MSRPQHRFCEKQKPIVVAQNHYNRSRQRLLDAESQAKASSQDLAEAVQELCDRQQELAHKARQLSEAEVVSHMHYQRWQEAESSMARAEHERDEAERRHISVDAQHEALAVQVYDMVQNVETRVALATESMQNQVAAAMTHATMLQTYMYMGMGAQSQYHSLQIEGPVVHEDVLKRMRPSRSRSPSRNHLVGIFGRKGQYVDAIVFKFANGREATYGGDSGQHEDLVDFQDGEILTKITQTWKPCSYLGRRFEFHTSTGRVHVLQGYDGVGRRGAPQRYQFSAPRGTGIVRLHFDSEKRLVGVGHEDACSLNQV